MDKKYIDGYEVYETVHNMSQEQAHEWIEVAQDETLKDNEIRLFILMSLLHDGWLGINKAFSICEKFEIFSISHQAIRHNFSKFSHPECYGQNGEFII